MKFGRLDGGPPGKHRRVVTGKRDGREQVVADSIIEAFPCGPDNEIVSIFGSKEPPTVPNDGTYFTDEFFTPVPGGIHVARWSLGPRQTVGDHEGKLEGDAAVLDEERYGYHYTDAVDVNFVVAGEISHEMEDGTEVTVKAGEWLIVNGTGHTWHNRTDNWASVLAIAVGARPDRD